MTTPSFQFIGQSFQGFPKVLKQLWIFLPSSQFFIFSDMAGPFPSVICRDISTNFLHIDPGRRTVPTDFINTAQPFLTLVLALYEVKDIIETGRYLSGSIVQVSSHRPDNLP